MNFWSQGNDSNQILCQKCHSSLTVKKLSEEFVRGENQSYRIEQTRNAITTSKYTFLNFFPKTMMYNYARHGNAFFLIISIIMLSNRDVSPYERNWVLIVPLMVFNFIYLIKEFILDMRRKKYDVKINNQIANRGVVNKQIIDQRKQITKNYKKKVENPPEFEDFDEIAWDELVVGDIVKVEKDNMVPADLIILDTNEVDGKDNICFIDSYLVDGSKEKQMKKACHLTKAPPRSHAKQSFKNYRSRLTMRLDFELPTQEMNSFNGHLKLNKDPKREVLSNENFLPRGSINKTGWVYGLVVYAGMDTKIMKNSNYQKIKGSFLDAVIKKLFLFTFFFVSLFAAVSMIILIAKSKDISFILEIDKSANEGSRLFSYFILYAQFIPLSIYGYLDIIDICQMYSLQMKKNYFGETVSKGQIQVNEPKILSDLGHIDYIMIDNCLFSGKYEIHNLVVNESIYNISQDDLAHKLVRSSFKGSFMIEETQQDKIKNKNIININVPNSNEYEPLQIEEVDPQVLDKNFAHKQNPLILFEEYKEVNQQFIQNDTQDRNQQNSPERPPQHHNSILSSQGSINIPSDPENQMVFHKYSPRNKITMTGVIQSSKVSRIFSSEQLIQSDRQEIQNTEENNIISDPMDM